MRKRPKICAFPEGCTKEHYAGGLCRAHYMREYRAAQKEPPRDPNDIYQEPDPDEPPAADKLLTRKSMDDLAARFAQMGPRGGGFRDKPDDTEAMKAARTHLLGKAVVFRRRIIREMLANNYLEEDVINEFLENPDLQTFTRASANVIRMVKDDMTAIDKGDDRWTGRVTISPQENYINNLERSLRLAYRFAEDMSLASRDRAAFAKQIPELNDRIAIFRRVAHAVPGRGMVPTGSGWDDGEDYDDEDEEDEDRLPNVRNPEDEPPLQRDDVDAEDH